MDALEEESRERWEGESFCLICFCDIVPLKFGWLKSIVDLRSPQDDDGGELLAHEEASSDEMDDKDESSLPTLNLLNKLFVIPESVSWATTNSIVYVGRGQDQRESDGQSFCDLFFVDEEKDFCGWRAKVMYLTFFNVL